MNCDDAAPLMEAYVDSQLDARSTAEVRAHLDDCGECAAAFAAAARDNERLAAFLNQPAAPAGESDAMWRRITRALAEETNGADAGDSGEPVPKSRFSRVGKPRRKWLIAAAGVAALAAATMWFWPRADHAARSIPAESAPGLVQALRRDHEEFLAGEFGPAFQGPPPSHVLSAATGRVDAAAFAALPSGDGITVEGSRLCHLYGVPVAWTLVRLHGQPVSWVALRRSELAAFPDIRAAMESGEPLPVTKTGAFHFAARPYGDHVLCALSERPPEELLGLMASVAPPPVR